MCKKICEECGREYDVYPCKKDSQRFCSRECVNKWLSESRRGENNPGYKPKITKVCEQCGNEFEVIPALNNRRFCSRECMGRWYSENIRGENHSQWKGGKIVKVCEQCGGEYEVDPHRADTNRFCSVECRGKWHSGENNPRFTPKIKLVCKQCGGEIITKQSHASRRRFCSVECYVEWQSENMQGENNPAWKGGGVTKTCEQCGEEFEVHLSRKDSACFCSRECYADWQSDNMCGKNNLSWRGGASFEPYCPKFNEAFKESIREKFDRVCFLCPITETENGRKLDVHHVNYNKDCLCDESDCEFVPLCIRCHAKTNHNHAYWENLIMEKLNGTYKIL